MDNVRNRKDEEGEKVLKTIRARYKNGVIEPLEKVDLMDGTEISVTITTGSGYNQKSMSEEERDRLFLSSAGGWRDLVDEDFLNEIYERRKRKTRPEVNL
jgi:predicted DNA-binding antitoxin AbrB/MazE fold protein